MKKIIVVAMALAFVASASTGVLASRIKCTVDSVDGTTVTLTCEDAGKLTAGDELNIRVPRERKALEGC